MTFKFAGYRFLIDTLRLPCLPLAQSARLMGQGARAALFWVDRDGQAMDAGIKVNALIDDVMDHVHFALRYEGVNLAVLVPLFDAVDAGVWQSAINDAPSSSISRRVGFLYEWVTGRSLQAPDLVKASYIDVVDANQQLAWPVGEPITRWRVRNNLLGNKEFCPMIRLTPEIKAFVGSDLKQSAHRVISVYSPELMKRAASYLYLNETKSTWAIERETPTPEKRFRFMRLLKQVDTKAALTEEVFADFHQQMLDPIAHEFGFRSTQNWLGERPVFVPLRPEDVATAMEGLMAFANRCRAAWAQQASSIEPVLATAAASFGFVFIHPFLDGNGRLHRFLMHDMLCAAGVTPDGIALPISQALLSMPDEYFATLREFSEPLFERTVFYPEIEHCTAVGNDAVYFRYFDATEQGLFLYKALQKTVEHILPAELGFLAAFDASITQLEAERDWPAKDVSLFVRLVAANEGELSLTKKAKFPYLKNDEIIRFQSIVREAYFPGSAKEPLWVSHLVFAVDTAAFESEPGHEASHVIFKALEALSDGQLTTELKDSNGQLIGRANTGLKNEVTIPPIEASTFDAIIHGQPRGGEPENILMISRQMARLAMSVRNKPGQLPHVFQQGDGSIAIILRQNPMAAVASCNNAPSEPIPSAEAGAEPSL